MAGDWEEGEGGERAAHSKFRLNGISICAKHVPKGNLANGVVAALRTGDERNTNGSVGVGRGEGGFR